MLSKLIVLHLALTVICFGVSHRLAARGQWGRIFCGVVWVFVVIGFLLEWRPDWG